MQAAAEAPHLSIIIITLNEEKHLEQCLRSLPRGSEVIVLDSGSTDRTCAIAGAFGARVETRPFINFADQKNAALAFASRPWVLSIDADEVMDRRLADTVAKIAEGPERREAAFRLRRRLNFMGRRMRFGKAQDRPVRLFRRGQASFEFDIHERLAVRGEVGSLVGSGELQHYSYDNLSDYFDCFNRYTTRIAENHAKRGRSMPFGLVHVLRPWGEFLYRYIVRLRFLDGYPGYTYALLSSLYTYVKYAKLKEHLDARKGLAT